MVSVDVFFFQYYPNLLSLLTLSSSRQGRTRENAGHGLEHFGSFASRFSERDCQSTHGCRGEALCVRSVFFEPFFVEVLNVAEKQIALAKKTITQFSKHCFVPVVCFTLRSRFSNNHATVLALRFVKERSLTFAVMR